MLETEEVDDDFFTPISNTTLSNIFGNSPQRNKASGNESLKYTPPKPIDNNPKPVEDIKATECIFACALTAYVWAENVYTAKGKLGFAIVKILKTNIHNIVLYDANKTTLSTATVTSNLEVTVKGNLYISYYDNLQFYWSLCGKEEDMKKVVETLQHLSVTIKFFQNTDETLPKPLEAEKIKSNIQDDKKNQGSDTDSSLNRKTKQSILNRMANMGHSVLPSQAMHIAKTSDSSDTSDTEKTKPRYKPNKPAIKRLSTDKTSLEITSHINTITAVSPRLEQPAETSQLYSLRNGQLIPVTSTSFLPSSAQNNDMSIFVTEQRISNSELRININRANDKVDLILEKLKCLESTDKSKSENFQIEVMQKLLTEYENKIDMYEKVLKEQNLLTNLNQKTKAESNRTDQHHSKIAELEQMLNDKNLEISEINKQLLQKEIEKENIVNDFQKQIIILKSDLELKDKELSSITIKLEEMSKESSVAKNDTSSDVENKLKSIMNDTFRAVSGNFEDTESYSGETVKNIVASIIKQVTVQSLSEVNTGK